VRCGKSFDTLTAMTMVDAKTHLFVCSCGTELQMRSNEEERALAKSFSDRAAAFVQRAQKTYEEGSTSESANQHMAPASQVKRAAPADEEKVEAEAKRMREAEQQDRSRAANPSRAAANRPKVFVQGVSYTFREVQENDELLDEMTQDEFDEYQRVVNA